MLLSSVESIEQTINFKFAKAQEEIDQRMIEIYKQQQKQKDEFAM